MPNPNPNMPLVGAAADSSSPLPCCKQARWKVTSRKTSAV